VHAVQALDGLTLGFRSPQLVMRVDAPDDQDLAVQFDFAGDLRNQLAVARVNLARFQRTAKSAGQSTACCGDDIIKCGCARWKFFRRDLVMLGHFGMDPEGHRIFFGGQPGQPLGAGLPFNPHPRGVYNLIVFRHFHPHRKRSSSLTAWSVFSSRYLMMTGA
jgi:hypothetical protein